MNLTQISIVAAAAAIVAAPWLFSLAKGVRLPRRGVSYHDAMMALSVVRSRLVQTGGVPDDACAAIEVVTHALVEGSDK